MHMSYVVCERICQTAYQICFQGEISPDEETQVKKPAKKKEKKKKKEPGILL